MIYRNYTWNPDVNKTRELFSRLVGGEGFMVVKEPLVSEFLTGVKCIQRPKEVNWEIFQKINALPKGSLFIFKKNEKNPFSSMNVNYKTGCKYIDLGNSIAIQLPVKISDL